MKYIAPHVPLMAYLHGLLLFSTLLFIYMWIFVPTKGSSTKHAFHMIEHYEEDEQWHEDFDFRPIQLA